MSGGRPGPGAVKCSSRYGAPEGGYTTMTGTSFATPIMCGFVALLLGAYPDLRPFEVKALLKAMSAEEPAGASG